MPSAEPQPKATGDSSTNLPDFDQVMTLGIQRREGLRRLGHLAAIESLVTGMATEDEFMRRDYALNERSLHGDDAAEAVGSVSMPDSDGEDDEMRLMSAGDITINMGSDPADKPAAGSGDAASPQPAVPSPPAIDYDRLAGLIGASAQPPAQPSLMSRLLPWALTALSAGTAAGLWLNSGDPGPDTDTQYELRLGGPDAAADPPPAQDLNLTIPPL